LQGIGCGGAEKCNGKRESGQLKIKRSVHG
jgi:hypothetical protein